MDALFGSSLTNTLLTDLGFDGVLGNLTPDDLYPTTIYTLDGDGVADFQQDYTAGGLLETLVNLFVQHVEYLGLTPTQIADATTSPTATSHSSTSPTTSITAPRGLMQIRARGRQQRTFRERIRLSATVFHQHVLTRSAELEVRTPLPVDTSPTFGQTRAQGVYVIVSVAVRNVGAETQIVRLGRSKVEGPHWA